MNLIFTDHNRRVLLQYRDLGKTRQYVAIVDGQVDCVQLTQKDWRGLIHYEKGTAEDFAKRFLTSHLPISRAARAILRGILGSGEGDSEALSDPRFSGSGGTVSLEDALLGTNINPSHARKFLRKNVDKPGGRWAWPPEEAEKIKQMLIEAFKE